MELYYQNETLFVDVTMALDDDNLKVLKRRIFHIVDDYDIDHIILQNRCGEDHNKRMLKILETEYLKRYKGRFYIK